MKRTIDQVDGVVDLESKFACTEAHNVVHNVVHSAARVADLPQELLSTVASYVGFTKTWEMSMCCRSFNEACDAYINSYATTRDVKCKHITWMLECNNFDLVRCIVANADCFKVKVILKKMMGRIAINYYHDIVNDCHARGVSYIKEHYERCIANYNVEGIVHAIENGWKYSVRELADLHSGNEIIFEEVILACRKYNLANKGDPKLDETGIYLLSNNRHSQRSMMLYYNHDIFRDAYEESPQLVISYAFHRGLYKVVSKLDIRVRVVKPLSANETSHMLINKKSNIDLLTHLYERGWIIPTPSILFLLTREPKLALLMVKHPQLDFKDFYFQNSDLSDLVARGSRANCDPLCVSLVESILNHETFNPNISNTQSLVANLVDKLCWGLIEMCGAVKILLNHPKFRNTSPVKTFIESADELRRE